ncbi:MAG: DUF1345 domain-containing protein, partial [Sphingomonadales bacterium]
FLAFIFIALAGYAIALPSIEWGRAVLIGFDVGAIVFLLSCMPLLRHQADAMRAAAQRNDANRAMLLAITAIVSAVVLVAVGVELARRAQLDAVNIALVIVTLLIAWLFSNMVYALHYAHLFYSAKPSNRGDCGGLDFPGDAEPNYWDFIYFAFTLGMTFQTSDVEISSRRIRKIVTLHCLAAFVFNLGILAFTINLLGS